MNGLAWHKQGFRKGTYWLACRISLLVEDSGVQCISAECFTHHITSFLTQLYSFSSISPFSSSFLLLSISHIIMSKSQNSFLSSISSLQEAQTCSARIVSKYTGADKWQPNVFLPGCAATSVLSPFCVIFMKVISRGYLKRLFFTWNEENIRWKERRKLMFDEYKLPLLSEIEPAKMYVLESPLFPSLCEGIMMFVDLLWLLVK